MREAKPLAAPPDAAAKARAKDAGAVLSDIDARRLVFVDGAFAPELSDVARLEAGLTIRTMAVALTGGDALVNARLGKVVPTEDPAVALNTAFMGDGAVIHVAAAAAIERPIHLVFAATGDKPAALFTRSLVVVEKGARVMLVESHEGAAGRDYQINTALELAVADNAHVDHIKITREGDKALHISSLMADVGAHARFNTFLFTTGGAVTRNQLFLRFGGDETIASVRGATLLKGKQHADTTMVVDHASRWLSEPRGVQDRIGRPEPRHFPGQDHRAARRAEDRRQDGLARVDAVRRGRGRQQAGAGNLR